jgi:hypothetical protein
MTPQQAVGLAGRLFAIWLALASIQSWMVVRDLQSQGVVESDWLRYSAPAIYWLAAAVLWLFPMSIAHRLIPRTRFEDRLRLPAQQVVLVACVALGLFVILVRALPALAAYGSMAAIWIANGQALSSMDVARHARLLEGAIELAVGLVFALKAHAITARLVPPAPAREHASPSLLADSAL